MNFVYVRPMPRQETVDAEILDVSEVDAYIQVSKIVPTEPAQFQRFECGACKKVHKSITELLECYENNSA